MKPYTKRNVFGVGFQAVYSSDVAWPRNWYSNKLLTLHFVPPRPAPPHLPDCPFIAQRVPLLSELAEAALPTFLQVNTALWKRCVRAFGEEELERIAEREYILRV